MSVEPFAEPFIIKANQGGRGNVGVYMVVVLLHIFPHLLIWNSKKSFSVEEVERSRKRQKDHHWKGQGQETEPEGPRWEHHDM